MRQINARFDIGHEPAGVSCSLLFPTGLIASAVFVFLVLDLSHSPRLEALGSLLGFLRTAFSLVVITLRSVRFSVMVF
jgi:hypothetical protein